MRIGGLASGIDTEGLLKDLMRSERKPLDRLFQRKQRAEWKRDAYRDVNAQLLRLRNAAFDLRLQSTYVDKKASSSNEQLVSATATGVSQNGSFTVKVDKLAEQARVTSDAGVASRFDDFVGGLTEPQTIHLRGQDGSLESITISKDDTINDVLQNMSNNPNIGIGGFYDSFTDRVVLSTNDTGSAARIDVALTSNGSVDFFATVLGLPVDDGSVSLAQGEDEQSVTLEDSAMEEGFTLTIGGQTYGVWDSRNSTFASATDAKSALQADFVLDINPDGEDGVIGSGRTEFLEQIETDIEENEEIGVTAFDTDTGTITLAPEGIRPLPALFASFGVAFGENAEVVINGLPTQRSSNDFEFNGATVSLHQVTDVPVRIDITQDLDHALNNIKSFVELYNEIIEDINTTVREPIHRDFHPLTDEQKEAMSESEVEMWEERAKSGLLRSDTLLTSVLTEMRMTLNASVGNLDGINRLSQIGITTGDWQEHGKLHINETRLKQALTNDFDDVIALFTNDSEDASHQGIGRQIHNTIAKGIEQITSTAGRESVQFDQSSLGNQIRRYDERMAAMEDRLIRVEDRYWRQFIAMEKVVNEMNQQADWLHQQIMGMMQ